jgi:two-component system nitrate/nitrite response regulator NarP
MPVLDGVTLLERLRAKQDRRAVIVLSAEIRDSDLVRLMKASVDSIVFKHEPEEHLCEAIKSVQQGRRHFTGDLLDKAMTLASHVAGRNPLDVLTDKERSIVMEVARGRRNRDIGDDLGLTEGSVKVYLHKIFAKLGIANRTELAILVRDSAPH